MTDLLRPLSEVLFSLKDLLAALLVLAARNALLIAWLAWALGAINWQKTWPVLAKGAWVPAVIALFMTALVWSQIAPSEYNLGIFSIGNFWWQLAAMGLLAGLTLLCGWLQDLLHWTPAELSLEPPAHAEHDEHHGHGHH